MFTRLSLVATIAVLGTLATAPAQAEVKKDFKAAWSLYVGWMA